MECRWQVEKDEYCSRVLAKHWPGVQRLYNLELTEEEILHLWTAKPLPKSDTQATATPPSPKGPNLNVSLAYLSNKQADKMVNRIIEVVDSDGMIFTGVCVAPPAHNSFVAIRTDDENIIAIRNWARITRTRTSPANPADKPEFNNKKENS